LGLVVVVVVGFLLDGRVRGPGDRALAEDVARGMAGDGIQTHQIELVPTPESSPRILHSVRRLEDSPHTARLESEFVETAAGSPVTAACVATLAAQVQTVVERESLDLLHAIGAGLAGRVALALQEQSGLPYCVTPRAMDLAATGAMHEETRAVLRAARHVVLFDEAWGPAVEAAFPARAGETPLRSRILRRGVDLELFKPVPRQERRGAAARLANRRELASRLQDIDWDRGCIVLCVQDAADSEGFANFLFALPELMRQQLQLQVLVVSVGAAAAAVDQLRAALAAGRPEGLQNVLQTSERYQPLLDHLERLHAEGRTESWWTSAARLEPERRVRYTGELSRTEFANLVALADVVVVPGAHPLGNAHVLREALACGVPAVAHAGAGTGALAQLVADEISPEIASLCVLRDGASAVAELEEKLGRFVRLRPELGERLRALAVRKFDGRQTAADLRRLYAVPARAAAARS
jgi:glycosyltransferase involved in cell wall biosynthesis